MVEALDAHARPPHALRLVYKDFQRTKSAALDEHAGLLQFDASSGTVPSGASPTTRLHLPADLRRVFEDFLAAAGHDVSTPDPSPEARIYEIQNMPALRKVGLFVYPSLLPPEVQLGMLDRLLHRDVSNPRHQTNVHLFHEVLYPGRGNDNMPTSFFDRSAADISFNPLDASIHKPFSIHQFWNKKLRWATLGGQYDWTNKVYPSDIPPAFPADIKQLIDDVFPMEAEAAILNLYSPGDTLSLHRDVSEECNQPLVSISIGCDAVFIVGLDREGPDSEPQVASFRLRSGDAVLMSGKSRYAWHGVPQVLGDTCPSWMQDWPARESSGQYEHWRGWMKNKRINLNVRQMFA